MKKLFTVALSVLILSLGLFNLKVNAYTASPASGDYAADSTVTINLLAKPTGTENAVSIGLISEGLTILSYTPPSADGWIGNTGDCANNQFYTSTTVCTSMAKTSAITEGESLGTITVKITGGIHAKLTKTSDNSYSDGTTIRTDTGVLAEFNIAGQSAFSNNSTNSDLLTTLQPVLIVSAIVVVLVLALLILWPRIRRKLNKQPQTGSSTPFQ